MDDDFDPTDSDNPEISEIGKTEAPDCGPATVSGAGSAAGPTMFGGMKIRQVPGTGERVSLGPDMHVVGFINYNGLTLEKGPHGNAVGLIPMAVCSKLELEGATHSGRTGFLVEGLKEAIAIAWDEIDWRESVDLQDLIRPLVSGEGTSAAEAVVADLAAIDGGDEQVEQVSDDAVIDAALPDDDDFDVADTEDDEDDDTIVDLSEFTAEEVAPSTDEVDDPAMGDLAAQLEQSVSTLEKVFENQVDKEKLVIRQVALSKSIILHQDDATVSADQIVSAAKEFAEFLENG